MICRASPGSGTSRQLPVPEVTLSMSCAGTNIAFTTESGLYLFSGDIMPKRLLDGKFVLCWTSIHSGDTIAVDESNRVTKARGILDSEHKFSFQLPGIYEPVESCPEKITTVVQSYSYVVVLTESGSLWVTADPRGQHGQTAALTFQPLPAPLLPDTQHIVFLHSLGESLCLVTSAGWFLSEASVPALRSREPVEWQELSQLLPERDLQAAARDDFKVVQCVASSVYVVVLCRRGQVRGYVLLCTLFILLVSKQNSHLFLPSPHHRTAHIYSASF